MCHFQRILVPLSMSEPDTGLLRYAAAVVRLGVTGAVRFVHVATSATMAADPLTLGDIRKKMEEVVDEQFGQPPDGVAVDFRVDQGPRIDKLVEASIEHQADVILLGHRKARSGQRSLARRLAMVTPCSVWLVPEGSSDRIERILAPIDLSRHSADSLGIATALARLLGIDACEALHVFFDSSTIRYDEHIAEVRGKEQQVLGDFLAGVNTHGVSVEPTLIESSRPAEAILRRAQQSQADLIVMSTRGRSAAAAILLGSVTAQTMAEAPMPVLAVKHFGAHLNLFEALKASRFWSRPNPKTN